MNKYRYIRILMALAFFIMLAACTDTDDRIGPKPDGGDKVRIEMFTRALTYDTPTTRIGGSQPDDIEMTPYIAVFKDEGAGNTSFVEVVRVIEFSGINKRYAELTRQSSGTFYILLLANNLDHFYYDGVRKEFNLDNLKASFTDQSLSDVGTKMLTDDLASPRQTTTPYTSTDWSHKLPMSYVLTINGGINDNTKIGEVQGVGSGPLLLVRGVAKVTITNELLGQQNFSLRGVYSIGNVRRQSKIVNLDGVPAAGIQHTEIALENYTSYIVETQDVNESWAPPNMQANYGSHLYLYEAPASENPFFILYGPYTGDFGNGTETRWCYYKMAAVDNNQQPLTIRRNYDYTFKLRNVKAPGYPTVEDAIAAPASSSTIINYTLTEVDLSSHHIVTNGTYHLGLTNSRYVTYTDTPAGQNHAFNLVTNYFQKWLGVSGPNYIKAMTAGITLTVGSQSGAEVKIPDTVTETNPAAVYVSFNGVTTGRIEVCIGNLIQSVNVEAKGIIPANTGNKPLAYYGYYVNPANTGDNGWRYTYYCVSGSVDSRNNGKTWIKMASGLETIPAAAATHTGPAAVLDPDPVKILDVTDQVYSSTGKIQVFVGNNPTTSVREGTFYLSTGMNPANTSQRQVERIKFDVKQKGMGVSR